MSEFFADLAKHAFLQRALIAALLASISCGVIGSFVVVRRISYIAGGISHCVLGGIGAAVYFKSVYELQWLDPMHGATLAALLSAVVIGYVSLRAKQREDTVISAVWAIGTAVGVLFLHMKKGYGVDLMNYLFGNIILVSQSDVMLIAWLNLLVVGAVVAFFNPFLAVCFDEEFARLRGVRVEAFYMLLLGLTALTVVVLTKVVGIVLAIALLTLPAALAGNLVRSLWQMMVLATVFCAVFCCVGLAVSYPMELPPGTTIILLAGSAYLLVVGSPAAIRATWRLFRRRAANPDAARPPTNHPDRSTPDAERRKDG